MSFALSSTRRIRFTSAIIALLQLWQREIEGGAAIHSAFGPRPSSVTLDDPANVRQADACPLELIGGVQALKHPKQLVHVLHVEADAVVADPERDLARLLLAADADLC